MTEVPSYRLFKEQIEELKKYAFELPPGYRVHLDCPLVLKEIDVPPEGSEPSPISFKDSYTTAVKHGWGAQGMYKGVPVKFTGTYTEFEPSGNLWYLYNADYVHYDMRPIVKEVLDEYALFNDFTGDTCLTSFELYWGSVIEHNGKIGYNAHWQDTKRSEFS